MSLSDEECARILCNCGPFSSRPSYDLIRAGHAAALAEVLPVLRELVDAEWHDPSARGDRLSIAWDAAGAILAKHTEKP